MSEQPEQDRGDAEPHAAAVEPHADVAQRTGHPAVDQVLASLEGLAERPVEEHAAVFEAAHDALRAALSDVDGPPDRASG